MYADDKAAEQKTAKGPELSIDALEQVIINTTFSKRSKLLPDDTRKAARRWMELQEAPLNSERPRQVQRAKGPAWETPYTDRLLQTYRKFISLTQADQQIIISAHEDGIHWRGDDMVRFYGDDNSIYAHTMRYREQGGDKYRKESRAIIHECINKMVMRDNA